MSYSEARNHFEKARINTADAVAIEMLAGLKHLSHAIEEDYRTLEQHIRNIQEQWMRTEPMVLNKTNRKP
jgi:hypothetical protein